MYDHSRQYKCTIVRGKSQKDMENLLPLYAKIIDSICPCDAEDFNKKFDDAIRPALKAKSPNVEPTQKTFANHRTEIAGALFGMYYSDESGVVYASERTLKFLEDGDTPAFFKDICYKMQFPNGSQKMHTVLDRVEHSINIRQYPFILKVMSLAREENKTLSKQEIGYYILNSLDVLQGIASPQEVYYAIKTDRQHGIEREIKTPEKGSSYDWQHITEQLNLLELANLVIIDGNQISINPNESVVVQLFATECTQKPFFDVYNYNLEDVEDKKRFYIDWKMYFASLSDKAGLFDTTAKALGVSFDEVEPKQSDEPIKSPSEQVTTVQIGDEGERYVYEYEKRRVTEFNFRLAGKVIHLGKTRGLGYDVQSVVAESGEKEEFVKYIEVKATKRVTVPDVTKNDWMDTLNITRSEWIAAQQHRDSYFIFRVYFVRNAVVMFVLKDIAKKCDDNIIKAVPMTYRIDFGNNAVDTVIDSEGGIFEYA
ncbi:MAG: DUF3883 domain-containing protein [Defluviitaleaceae bacterium]|nr:DUF3883 domain-containing protein [Defluviitaleaceae bacterium]